MKTNETPGRGKRHSVGRFVLLCLGVPFVLLVRVPIIGALNLAAAMGRNVETWADKLCDRVGGWLPGLDSLGITHDSRGNWKLKRKDDK